VHLAADHIPANDGRKFGRTGGDTVHRTVASEIQVRMCTVAGFLFVVELGFQVYNAQLLYNNGQVRFLWFDVDNLSISHRSESHSNVATVFGVE